MAVSSKPVYIKPSRRDDVDTEIEKKHPYESIMHYISHIEGDYLNGSPANTSPIETKLIELHTLYMAAWAIGELTWDEAYYAYADFTAKLLHIR